MTDPHSDEALREKAAEQARENVDHADRQAARERTSK
jgi:hypothetical protein